ncbi:hypothetical protein HPB49_002951 [Dermacentor silvarum]|uniref:Uncharacterized protein n=1 Tax=Dermacentor silvarum TaxID=543639 RepID=A0ACB8DTE5_DERSI|nr:hypothetical protein HPB49_002951 [Dermacentor silvarum]
MRDGPKVKKNTQDDVEPQPVDPETGQLIQAALQKRVAQLEDELQATRRKLQIAQRERLQALTANKSLVAGLNKYLNEDQVKCLKMATMRGTRWTKKTVIKALTMKLSCGARGYDSVRQLGQPLPTERTLHRHLEGYKFTPGLLEDIMQSLALKALFLEKYNFKFLLLSRFGQDALENLFSTLRCKNPVPRVLEFKFSLLAATMAQFLRPSKDGSYTEEDCFLLTGMADDNKSNETKMYVVRPSDLLDIEDSEHESLEYLAGYVVAQVKKANSCQACVEAITSSAEGNKLTMLKCYNKENPALTVPSPAVLQFIETAENYVSLNEDALIANRVSASKLQSTIQSSLYLGNCFPTCHCISDKLLATFLRTRISILVKKKNHLLMAKSQSSQKCGSRSIGMHVAADSLR